MRIYRDTSVINGLYADNVDIKIATHKFFEFVKKTGAVLYSKEALAEYDNEKKGSKIYARAP